ncbi:MAG TPA: WhiB family transcriptional regulator [Acidimicrobiales bacterium]|nr:WhiB family transcriptional regulator [Acidimicrobiales bacterium]
MASGACRSVPLETMFPSDSHGVTLARRVCRTCPVRHQCLEYALMNRIEDGIWGGMSTERRRRLAKDRRTVSTVSEQ